MSRPDKGFFFLIMYDIEYAYLSEAPKFVRKRNYDAAKELIDKHIDKIFNCYGKLVTEHKTALHNAEVVYNERADCLERRVCYHCGGKLIYRNGYDFWGCENFRQPGDHDKHRGLEPVIIKYTPSFSDMWLTTILKFADLYGEVNTKELYQYLVTENGYDDLLLRYENKSSKDKFDLYSKTRVRSIDQELKALRYLDTIYNKVLYQQCIYYKLKDKKETFCIPDFICSIANEVHVIDAKLDYAKDEKMHLYVELLCCVLASKGDNRRVKGLHILNEEEVYSDFDYIKIPKS